MRGAALLVAALAGTACTAGGGGSRRLEFERFTVSVPAGWSHVVLDRSGRFPVSEISGPGVRLTGPDGEYIDVALDVGMGLPDADAWWLARVDGEGRVRVTPRDSLCRPPAPGYQPPPEEANLPLPACRVGDGRLDVTLSFRAGGHVYVLMFGNDRREREADLPALTRVLETMVAR